MRDIRETKMTVDTKGVVPAGFPYPWPSMNDASRGVQPGEVVVVTARAGDMKTWTLCAFAAAQYFCGTNKRVLVRSFDTRPMVLLNRVSSLLAGVPYQELRQAVPGPVKLPQLPDVDLNFSSESLRRYDNLMEEVNRFRPGLLLIDAFNDMEMEGGRLRDPNSLSYALELLRTRAQEMDMAVVLTVQAAHAFPNPREMLNQDSLSCEADVLIRQRPYLMAEKGEEPQRRLVVQVLKSREWEMGGLISELPPSGTFRELRTISREESDTWFTYGAAESRALQKIKETLGDPTGW